MRLSLIHIAFYHLSWSIRRLKTIKFGECAFDFFSLGITVFHVGQLGRLTVSRITSDQHLVILRIVLQGYIQHIGNRANRQICRILIRDRSQCFACVIYDSVHFDTDAVIQVSRDFLQIGSRIDTSLPLTSFPARQPPRLIFQLFHFIHSLVVSPTFQVDES